MVVILHQALKTPSCAITRHYSSFGASATNLVQFTFFRFIS